MSSVWKSTQAIYERASGLEKDKHVSDLVAKLWGNDVVGIYLIQDNYFHLLRAYIDRMIKEFL